MVTRQETGGTRDARFSEYVVPEVPVMLRVARRFTGNLHDAEDLVQETLIRAYRGLDGFDGRHPRAWLFTILRNTHLVAGSQDVEQPAAHHEDLLDAPACADQPGAEHDLSEPGDAHLGERVRVDGAGLGAGQPSGQPFGGPSLGRTSGPDLVDVSADESTGEVEYEFDEQVSDQTDVDAEDFFAVTESGDLVEGSTFVRRLRHPGRHGDAAGRASGRPS